MEKKAAANLQAARRSYAEKQFESAERELRAVLAEEGGNTEANLLLGIICAKSKRLQEADRYLDTALTNEADSFDALIWLATVRQMSSRFEEAIGLCEKAIRLNPGDARAHNTLGLCFLSMREASRAAKAFSNAISADPNSAPIYHNLGLALELLERVQEATAAYRKAIELAPDAIANYMSLSQLLLKRSIVDEAIECLESGLKHIPDSPQLLTSLAMAYADARDAMAAEASFRRALAINPASANAYGIWLQEEGRFEESFGCFEQSILANPRQGYGYYGLINGKRFGNSERALLDKMLSLVDDPALIPVQRTYLFYALGKAFDQLKEYEKAMGFYDLANETAYRVHNAGRLFHPQMMRARHDRTIRRFDASFLESHRGLGSKSTKPLFLVGMIRSGTTLLEQILSSHSMVGAAGELRFWIDEASRVLGPQQISLEESDVRDLETRYLRELASASPTSPFVSDKMPLNYAHLGLIHVVFPEARILHIRRNPVDTCLSIYMTYFGSGPNFAYRKEGIVFFYREYLRLMEHWRSVLPKSRFLEVDYEELISESADTIRTVVEFCGLPWEEACLHHEENTGAINTPSRWQARQAIYKSSVERWRRYEPWLGAFSELLNVSPQFLAKD